MWNGKIETRKDYDSFCGECGWYFNNDKGFSGSCPKCGTYELYENTERGAEQSIRAMEEHENAQT